MGEKLNICDMPIVAICYDFDKTLSPCDMQKGFIESMGEDVGKFWNDSNSFAKSNNMDQNLAYMFSMKELAEGKQVFTKNNLRDYGAKITLFDGLTDWFDRINCYGKQQGVIVEHYIISSGLKEMIEGNDIAKNFKQIYASSFYYNDKGVAIWPAQVINYTNKTQFLFRIEKGVLDVNNSAVNNKYNEASLRVPFQNIVYIGDSATDVPCMKLVNQYGGNSIGVYNENETKEYVYNMIKDNRIKYFVPANYTKNSMLENLIHSIIDNIVTTNTLKRFNKNCINEIIVVEENNKNNIKQKETLIAELRTTEDYGYYMYLITEIPNFNFDNNQLKELLIAFNSNSFFSYAIRDNIIQNIVEKILQQYNNKDKHYKHISNKLNWAKEQHE